MITVGQLSQVLEAIPQLAFDAENAGVDLSNLPADAAVAEDILALLAPIWPPATVLALAIAIAVAIAPAVHITPDSGANAEPLGRGGRRG